VRAICARKWVLGIGEVLGGGGGVGSDGWVDGGKCDVRNVCMR